MKKSKLLFLILPLFVSLLPLQAQTSASDPSMTSTQFDTTGFPQWAKDARRYEIVAFGSFPFAYFFTNFAVDSIRCASNGWDTSYAPWPFTGPAAADKTQNEKFMTIGFAVGGALVIALVDYGIELYKRNKKEMEIRNLPGGTPIIIRSPLGDTETGASGQGDTGSP